MVALGINQGVCGGSGEGGEVLISASAVPHCGGTLYLLVTEADVGELIKFVVHGYDIARLVLVVVHVPNHDSHFTLPAQQRRTDKYEQNSQSRSSRT